MLPAAAYALDIVLAESGYEELRAEQERRRAAGDRKLLGLGLSVYVEITNPDGGGEFGSIEVLADGRTIRVRAKSVVNAAGPWVDRVRRLGDATLPLSRWSRPITIGARTSPAATSRLNSRPALDRSP